MVPRTIKDMAADSQPCSEPKARTPAPSPTSGIPGRPVSPRRSLARLSSVRTTVFALLGVALFITVVDNGSFFSDVLDATARSSHRFAILLSMFVLVMSTLVALLSVAPERISFRVLASLLLIAGSAVGYFMSNYGVVIDPSMIRNVAETDAREASPLLTSAFFLHVAGFGLVPAVLIQFLPLGGIGWRRAIGVRLSVTAATMLILSGTLYANFGPVSYFAQQNHVLRMEINPVYPLYALYRYVARADDRPPAVREPLPARRLNSAAATKKQTLFVFVMGETARADRFSLNGYERETNRFTPGNEIVNFTDVSACGTSTADSVPCIFSRFGHDGFSHAEFAVNESLFQTLGRLGIATGWRDNSTGCKSVCTPETLEFLAGASDPDYCHDNVCIDEILLQDFWKLVADESHDHFVVLHQRGSHGPAYYVDSPPEAKVWLPECDQASLTGCDSQSINNAYDNTIVYTDYFLAQVIDLMKAESDRYDTAMLYVSDHGESLGEKGLYLHGMPYAVAPSEQTKVPMIFWGSSGFYASHSIDETCLRASADRPWSHDAIFHSILSIFDIVSPAYDRSSDIFAACRSGAPAALTSRSAPL